MDDLEAVARAYHTVRETGAKDFPAYRAALIGRCRGRQGVDLHTAVGDILADVRRTGAVIPLKVEGPGEASLQLLGPLLFLEHPIAKCLVLVIDGQFHGNVQVGGRQ